MKGIMKTASVMVLLFLSGVVHAQNQFVTEEAKFIYNLVKLRGADYFEKNVEKEFKNKGYVLDDDMIFINVGEALKKEKKTDESIAVFKFGTKTWPNIIMLWNGLGEAYLQKGSKTEAKKCFEIVLKKAPQNERAKDGIKSASQGLN